MEVNPFLLKDNPKDPEMLDLLNLKLLNSNNPELSEKSFDINNNKKKTNKITKITHTFFLLYINFFIFI